jgi:hypothetical protein
MVKTMAALSNWKEKPMAAASLRRHFPTALLM